MSERSPAKKKRRAVSGRTQSFPESEREVVGSPASDVEVDGAPDRASSRLGGRRLRNLCPFERDQMIEMVDDGNVWWLGRVITAEVSSTDMIAVFFTQPTRKAVWVKLSRCVAATAEASAHGRRGRRKAVSVDPHVAAKAEQRARVTAARSAAERAANEVADAERAARARADAAADAQAKRIAELEAQNEAQAAALEAERERAEQEACARREAEERARREAAASAFEFLQRRGKRALAQLFFERAYLHYLPEVQHHVRRERAREAAIHLKLAARLFRRTMADVQPFSMKHVVGPMDAPARSQTGLRRLTEEGSIITEVSSAMGAVGAAMRPLFLRRVEALRSLRDAELDGSPDSDLLARPASLHMSNVAQAPVMRPMLAFFHEMTAPLSELASQLEDHTSTDARGYGRRLQQCLSIVEAMCRRAKNPHDLRPVHYEVSKMLTAIATKSQVRLSEPSCCCDDVSFADLLS